ncbi:hypothetical protein [Yersinia phage fHe-Yen9-04]|uniref:Trimeric autotransporter adhesin YadA-like C-terminal membrane anchor domain-containing protein n=1 Tax=Yersinia phage fHe-Yen9-04 TaxID=2052742 RepID=A0A2C9CZB7_9CAUD|nr:adhesin [Yersinia phage fHe-Yen9-04]SOK58718.1 hypothetical protein [Yersinia phage fHe-Yen9-04]VUE36487.1 hypothetical protein [Yersinia phage fHe-Yen9-04]
MKKTLLALSIVVASMTAFNATAAVSLKSSGDQFGPAMSDLLQSNENGNWNQQRFMNTFNNRFNGTEAEALALFNAVKGGNVPTSLDSFNSTLPSSGGTVTKGDKGDKGDKGENGADGTKVSLTPDGTITLDDGKGGTVQQDLATQAELNQERYKLEQKDKEHDVTLTDHETRLDTVENMTNGLNVVVGTNKQDIEELKDGKADKKDLDKEVADRDAGDKVLDSKIDNVVSNQSSTDAAQNAAIDSKVDKTTQAAKDSAQDTAIGNKVDKSQYNTDKVIQGIHDAAQDNAIIGLAVTKADKKDLDKEVADRKTADNKLQSNIDNEANVRNNADVALKNNIDKNKADQLGVDTAQNAVIDTKASKQDLNTEVDERKVADKKLQKNIDNEANVRNNADQVLSSRIDTNSTTLVQHDQRITSNTQRVGVVENRVTNLEQSTNRRFTELKSTVDDNRKVASAGIAGAGAMANIPQVSQNSTFSVGAGIGGYDSEQAVAVGFSARINNNIVTKVAVSTNTQSELLWGAGVGVEW